MLKMIFNWLQDWWKGRYIIYLETENAQLKLDLRDMTNSLLSAQGLPAIGPRQTRHSTRVPLNKFAIPSQQRRSNEQFVRNQVKQLEEKDNANRPQLPNV